MDRKKLIAIIAVVVVVVAAVSLAAVYLMGAPPTQEPTHVYAVEGDSEWFELPAGVGTSVSALVTDNGAPLFGIRVNVTVSPNTEGSLSSTSATTGTSGAARFSYLAYNRSANSSLTFTFRGVVGGAERTGATEVRQLGIGWQPATARAKGVVSRSSDRLPIANATIQVNLRNMTGLPPNTLSFYSNNSDVQGRYLVKDVPVREAFIQIVKTGFHSQRQNLTLAAGKNTRRQHRAHRRVQR
ncbi:MAG: hypothetical protein AABY30_05995, partial [Candidatus Thermoplasmatota archaeon]